MSKTKRLYRKYTIALKNRNQILQELEYDTVRKVTDKVDLLVNDNDFIIDAKKIKKIYEIDVATYQDLLFSIKKKLGLRSRTDVLKLILDKDKIEIKTALDFCNWSELQHLMAALAVFSDSYLHRLNKLVLIIEEDKADAYEMLDIHYFFKVYYGDEKDDRLLRFPPWYYFARLLYRIL